MELRPSGLGSRYLPPPPSISLALRAGSNTNFGDRGRRSLRPAWDTEDLLLKNKQNHSRPSFLTPRELRLHLSLVHLI